MLTVTGPGGVGKSRLVKEAIRRQAPLFSEALWLPLDDLRNTSQAVARLASALDLAPSPQQDAVALLCANTKLRRMVLVLDNAENVEGLPRLAERLLGAVPGLKICATSRVRLGVRGEWLLPLSGLALPAVRGPASEQLDADAARLFIAAAAAVRPDFDPSTRAHDIVRLVRAVDGLPLAILLAANWVRMLPVERIVAELERSLDVLDAQEEGEERPEHRSVRATFEQSWRLLTAAERPALESLSVFIGTFALAAARDVADAPWPLFAGLADKSLLQMLDSGRCSLHPLIRQFAGERLDALSRRGAIARHAAWFHRFLADVERDYQSRGPKALDAIDVDLENCRAAWRWAVSEAANDALATSATTLFRYFEIRGRALEGLELLGEATAVIGSKTTTACAASVVSAIAHLQYRVYRNDDAIATARRALKLARAAGNRVARLRSMNVLGLCYWQAGRHAEAKRFLDHLSGEHRAQLRRDPAAHRFAAAHRQPLGRHAGQLEGRRGCDHRAIAAGPRAHPPQVSERLPRDPSVPPRHAAAESLIGERRLRFAAPIMAHRFFIVDVFAERRYAGNPLAVVVGANDLPAETMRQIAAETNYSETTFVTSAPEDDGGYRVRIFTPAREIAFAGHPILGTAWVVRHRVAPEASGPVRLLLAVGPVQVTFESSADNEEVAWFLAPPMSLGATCPRESIAAAVGLSPEDIDSSVPVQQVSAGSTSAMIVPLCSLDALRRSRLDLAAFAPLQAEGFPPLVYLFCRETHHAGNDLCARFFFDAHGAREDPATGNGAAFLGAYLLEHRLLPGSDLSLRIEQGYEIRRRSLVMLRARWVERSREVSVGGKVIPTVDGQLL